MQEKHYLIPHHHKGVETDIYYTIDAASIEEAEEVFVDAKDLLLDVTNWERYGAITAVNFGLSDTKGKIITRAATRGDHVMIRSTGTRLNEDYDWFTIDALEYDDYPDANKETFAIRLHCTHNPNEDKSLEGATDEATATIVIERVGSKLSAIFHGRNIIVVNVDGWHGLNNNEWRALLKGFLEYIPE